MADLGEGEEDIPLGPTFVKELVNDRFVAYVNSLHRRPARLTTFINGLQGEILEALLSKELHPVVRAEINPLLVDRYVIYANALLAGREHDREHDRFEKFIMNLEGDILDVLLLKKKLRPEVKEEIEALLKTPFLKGHMNGGQKRRNKKHRRKSRASRKKHRRKSKVSHKKHRRKSRASRKKN